MNENSTEQAAVTQTSVQPVSRPKNRIKAFGIGTAGTNVLERLLAKGFPASAAVALNAGGAISSAGERLSFPLPNAALPVLAPAEPPAPLQDQAARLKALTQETDYLFICAGLGGKSGTRLAPALAHSGRKQGAVVIAFVLMPFQCEGNLRTEAAELGLREIKEAANLVVCLPNDRALAVVPECASLLESFKAADELLGNNAAITWQFLLSDSLMGLSFAELCHMTRELSSDVSFAAVESTGPTRVKEAADRLFSSPLLAGSESLKDSPAICAFILGGHRLPLVDINSVMERVRQESAGAPVLMGAATRSGPDDQLVLGLLVARQQGAVASGEERRQAAAPEGLAPRHIAPPTNPDSLLVKHPEHGRPGTRMLPPAPEMSQQGMEQLRNRQAGSGSRGRKANGPRLRQTTLPLDIVSKGRFDKSEPTIHKGEDLDVPTYIRRGVQLN